MSIEWNPSLQTTLRKPNKSGHETKLLLGQWFIDVEIPSEMFQTEKGLKRGGYYQSFYCTLLLIKTTHLKCKTLLYASEQWVRNGVGGGRAARVGYGEGGVIYPLTFELFQKFE